MRIALRVTCIALLLLTRLAPAQVRPISASPIPIVDSVGTSVGNYFPVSPNSGSSDGYALFDVGDGRVTAQEITSAGFDPDNSTLAYTSSNCSGTGYWSLNGDDNSSGFDVWRTFTIVADGVNGEAGTLYAPKSQQTATITANSVGSPGNCSPQKQPSKFYSVVPFAAVANLNQIFTPPFYLVTLAAPTFFPLPGTNYAAAAQVALHAATTGATIYYTTDGSVPTPSSAKYTGKIDAFENTTIKAISVSSAGYTQSPVVTAFYGILTGGVTFSPPPGKYPSAQQVTLTGPNSSVAIYYTNNTSSLRHLYNAPISVASTTTINAFAQAEGYEPSLVASATYTIGP